MKIIVIILISSILKIYAQDFDSQNVSLVYHFSLGKTYALSKSGDIILMGNGNYLQIIDTSDKADLKEITKILLPSFIKK